jgi:hypothetical protein
MTMSVALKNENVTAADAEKTPTTSGGKAKYPLLPRGALGERHRQR